MLTKKEAENLMKIKGEIRGIVFKIDWNFILEKKGKNSLKKLEAKMAESGFPLKYKEIKPMDFYPVGLCVISRLTIKELFNFNEKDIKILGASAVKFSIFIKIFMKYFGSLDLIARQVPDMWRKHYTIGDLEMPEYSDEKRYIILKLRNFQVHPIYCDVYKGYFSKIAEMVVKDPVTCKETKCMFKGDKHHEFLLRW